MSTSSSTLLAALSTNFSDTQLWLLDAAVKGAVLLVIAAIAAACLKRRSAATLHRLWLFAFAGCLLVAALPLVAPQ